MITDQNTFAKKQQLLRDLGQQLQQMMKARKITEARAEEIVAEIKQILLPTLRPESFKIALAEFVERCPECSFVLQKVSNQESESIQKIAESNLEPLMESDPDTWTTLIDEVGELTEENLPAWVKKLPTAQKEALFKKLLNGNHGN